MVTKGIRVEEVTVGEGLAAVLLIKIVSAEERRHYVNACAPRNKCMGAVRIQSNDKRHNKLPEWNVKGIWENNG